MLLTTVPQCLFFFFLRDRAKPSFLKGSIILGVREAAKGILPVGPEIVKSVLSKTRIILEGWVLGLQGWI